MRAPSLDGARAAVGMLPMFEQIMNTMGGHSDWVGRVGARVLPASNSLVDDPAAKAYQGQPLLGGYEADEEGERGERVAIVENGILKNLLLSRPARPDLDPSNGPAGVGAWAGGGAGVGRGTVALVGGSGSTRGARRAAAPAAAAGSVVDGDRNQPMRKA